MQLAIFSWRLYLFTILKILESLKIILSLLCLCSMNGKTKPKWQLIGLQHGLLNNLSPSLRPNAQKQVFQNTLLIDNAPDHPRAVMKMYEIMFSCLLTQYPFCNQRSATFKSYLEIHFVQLQLPWRVIPLMHLGKINWKPSRKEPPFQITLKTFAVHGKRSKYQHQ